VGYWNDETYPYPWPGGIHKAAELEEHWSSWEDTARYARLGELWLTLPEFF